MLKITAIVSLMFIVSSVWAGCDSCGSECESACGTRRFRACCFNYLRKKRGPDAVKIHLLTQKVKEGESMSKIPIFILDSIPEQWIANVLSSESKPPHLEDMVENRMD